MSGKKQLQSQSKEIIAKVYHRMKYEAENGVEKLTDARWRTSQAVGVSESTITRILREERQASSSTDTSQSIFKSPTTRKRRRPKASLDDFDVSALRSTIMSFHIDFNELPTLRKLKQIMTDRIGYDGCLETLRRILRESGYEWVNTDTRRKALVEKHDIQILRLKYLKQLKKYRNEGRYIVFTDEGYIMTSAIQNSGVKKVKEESPPPPKSCKGMCIIMVHAGGCKGFIPNASLIFKETLTTGYYYDKMNHDTYKTWLTKQLLPSLPENAVIVMDNASCHNVLSDDIPNFNSNKIVMTAWLSKNNILFDESMEKIELYDLILKNKDAFKSFEIDKLIRSQGFEVLRLPPHHPELNPIEKLWGIIKNYVIEKTDGQDVRSILALINERIEMIDRTWWECTCRQVENTEKQYLQYFNLDKELIVNENDSDSDDSDSSDLND